MSLPTPSTDLDVNVETKESRDALVQSEKKAAQPQPENFKDKANEEKLVEVGADLNDHPIRGIDPAG